MIKITPPILKLVAKELTSQLNNITTKPSNEALLEIVFKSHNYISLDSIPNCKHVLLNKITKNLMNALNNMNYDYGRKAKVNLSHTLISQAYGYKDHHVFRIKQKQSLFDIYMEEAGFEVLPPVLFRKHNKGYKEDNPNWLNLPIIYIRIPRPNITVIEVINKLDGIKFLSDTELKMFLQSYESLNNKWPKKIDHTKDTIIKLVNFRVDDNLKIDDNLVETINAEFYKFLPDDSEYYQLLNPIAYIINNNYLSIPSSDDEGFNFPSPDFWD